MRMSTIGSDISMFGFQLGELCREAEVGGGVSVTGNGLQGLIALCHSFPVCFLLPAYGLRCN